MREEKSAREEESANRAANGEWSDNLKDITVNDFTEPFGKTFDKPADCMEKDLFEILFNEDILALIVTETNRYARQKLTPAKLGKWTDVTVLELKAYLGVRIIMGINPLPATANYWSTDIYLGNEGIQKVFTRNRFDELTRFLHFNDSSTEPRRNDPAYDRLYKVRPLLNFFNARMQELYKPGREISVDEGMIAFRGRLAFKQYMPAKPTKYGIKVWIGGDAANGFVVNQKVYLGKEKNGLSADGLGYDVIMAITEPYLNKNHHVYFDNYFSSPKLLESLEKKGTYACSTVRPNRKGLPTCADVKLKKQGEKLIQQKGNLVYVKWHDKRDVNVISTNYNPKDADVSIERKKNGEVETVLKPKSIVEYNKFMGGVDHSDHLRSLYSTGRSSRKWYRYIFWFLFEVPLGNAFILFKQHVRGGRRGTVLNFRMNLAKQLIGGFTSRTSQRRMSEKAASVSRHIDPENATDHFIGRIIGRKRHCVKCKSMTVRPNMAARRKPSRCAKFPAFKISIAKLG